MTDPQTTNDPASNQTSRIELPHEALMLEGIASQMRVGPAGARWWHDLAEKERERWREKARIHIEQLGWK